jgi:hypothetical protein
MKFFQTPLKGKCMIKLAQPTHNNSKDSMEDSTLKIFLVSSKEGQEAKAEWIFKTFLEIYSVWDNKQEEEEVHERRPNRV